MARETWQDRQAKRQDDKVCRCADEWRARRARANSPACSDGSMNQLYGDWIYLRSCLHDIQERYPEDIVKAAASRLGIDISKE